MEEERMRNILVVWRGKQLNVDVDPDWKVKDVGEKLLKLTNVNPDTMRLLVPQSKTSKLIIPFSAEYSALSLRETSILELPGKPIRMMGAFDNEIREVSQDSMKPDLRIIGFEEEEKRLRQRSSTARASLQLPKGTYIFGDFRTLHLSGIELNPPASEALRRMHMLACDPGIIAIMNKHRWRVGVMTEMAPVGYVGISPKCLLGLNKNQGEEISLRLRTDDLKGFRKYESIKETLLHELAHMVYSEHDANFYALDKQLNKEAAALDWTKARSHTLSGHKTFDDYEEETVLGTGTEYRGQKLGGTLDSVGTARSSSVAAAYHRLLNASTPANGLDAHETDALIEPDPDDGRLKVDQGKMHMEPDPDDIDEKDAMQIDFIVDTSSKGVDDEPDPDDYLGDERMLEPDPDDSLATQSISEPDADDSQAADTRKSSTEPDLDDSMSNKVDLKTQVTSEPDLDDSIIAGKINDGAGVESRALRKNCKEPDPDASASMDVLKSSTKMQLGSEGSQETAAAKAEPDPDDHMDRLDDHDLQIIEEPVAAICSRLQRAIQMLRSEVPPEVATSSLQTLFKIIRNVIEHPDEVKYRRLRKANPLFQKNVANYKAAMELLTLIGFCEDVISDEVGRAETYMILKRNDPGLLWLAKSSLEVSIS